MALKTANVVPQGSALDAGTNFQTATDALGLNGRPTGEGGLIQSYNGELNARLNMALTACGAATATVTSQAKTVNTLVYLIDGVFKSKAATDNFWTLTGTAVTAGGTGATLHYALCINAAGAASVVQGPTNNAGLQGPNGQILAGSTTVWQPAAAILLPADVCIAAILKISLTATTVFTPGTTLLGAAGVTSTFTDGMDGSLWGPYLLTATLI